MGYIGNNLQAAFSTYKTIDDISGSFNGVTTSFALTVSGVAPVPAPLASNQCLISVGGVVQRPDDTGAEGFRLSGGNIVFSSAPNTGEDFFGVILAGADYVNVGVNFPSGSVSTPSITFDSDLDTGLYNPGANQLGFTTAGVNRLTIDASGNINLDSNTLYVDAVNNRVGIGTTSPGTTLDVVGEGARVVKSGDASNPRIFFQPIAGGAQKIVPYQDFADAGCQLAFCSGFAGAERARIDSSGRLLVGTSTARTPLTHSPSLQVEGVGYAASTISVIGNSSDNNGAYSFIGKTRGTSVGSNTIVQSGDEIGGLDFIAADGTQLLRAARITAMVDGTPGTNDMPGRLMFSTTADGASSSTERMRINSNGVTVTYDFNSVSGVLTGAVAARGFATRTGLNGSYVGNHFNFNWNGNLVAYIDLTNIGNVTLTSDYRIKQDIEDQLLEAIPRIKQLRPVVYKRANYNNIVFEDGVEREGFIAHELAEVIPSAVEGEKDAENQIQSINIDALVSVLTKALQETVAKVEALEQRLADAGIA